MGSCTPSMTRLQHQQSLLLQLLLVPILISRSVMAAEAAPPRQKTLPWPLPLPPINTGLRQQGEQEGSAFIFKVWESLAKTERQIRLQERMRQPSPSSP